MRTAASARPRLLDFLITILFAALTLLHASPAPAAPAYPEMMFILDASGSMWGQAGGEVKIKAAKEVLAQVVPALPPEVKVGLTVYGHRVKGDCNDVEVMLPPGSNDRAGLLARVDSVSPKGKTPLAHSVSLVADLLKSRENETTIVLVSDGLETCHDDPCGAVAKLKQAGIKFVLHVVGFGVEQKEEDQLKCLAQAGGGVYFSAGDAAALTAALQKVEKEVAVKVEAAKTTKVATSTGLGKLRIVLPEDAVKHLEGINLLRASDGKLIKKAKPAADSTHPLPSGDYRVVLSFANPNYKPPTEAPAGQVTVAGGRTAELVLGAVLPNLAPELGKAVEAIRLVDEATGAEFATLERHGNDYYLWMAKAAPAGAYRMELKFARLDEFFPLAGGIKVEPGRTAAVTVDSGLALKEAAGVTGWDVYPAGGDKPVLKVRRRFDNSHPLWEAFPLAPGAYDVAVIMEGMAEPLKVGQGVSIAAGQTMVLDTGL